MILLSLINAFYKSAKNIYSFVGYITKEDPEQDRLRHVKNALWFLSKNGQPHISLIYEWQEGGGDNRSAVYVDFKYLVPKPHDKYAVIEQHQSFFIELCDWASTARDLDSLGKLYADLVKKTYHANDEEIIQVLRSFDPYVSDAIRNANRNVATDRKPK